MHVLSTFEHSHFIELAITSLVQKGIPKENILAVPLSNTNEERKLFDTIHYADGVSLFDKGAAIGTALSVVGASIGFKLQWGPIYWGLIGAAAGFSIGVILNLLIYKIFRKQRHMKRGKKPEVILIIECDYREAEMILTTLRNHYALGVAKLNVEGS